MKNLKTNLNKIHFALMLCVFGVAFSTAQIIVRVPPLCNVVVAGTGGTTGFGGKVGDGGIVVMPDPFDQASPAGDFTIGNIPVTVPATNITGWTLKGDLSFPITTPIAGAPIQTSTGVLVQNIESYNKILRSPSEDGVLYPSSDKKWGRSKGTVRIYYTSPPCNTFITFEVFKSYSNNVVVNGQPITWVPPIVGPDCVEPNKTYTYSVDQIASDNAGDAIGFDSYYWSGLPSGAINFYQSADKSSITFTTPPTLSGFTLVCAYGRSNPFDGDGIYTAPTSSVTYVKKTVDLIPIAPLLTQTNIAGLSATSPTCLNTGVATFSVAVTTPLSGFTYTWSYGGGSWTSTISGANQQIITLTNVDNNPGMLTLKIRKTSIPTGCESVFNYVINRNFTSAIAINGPSASPICLSPNSSNGFSLPSLAAVNALNNLTTWTVPLTPAVPTSWTINNVNGTGSAVNIGVPANTPAGAYTISAKSTLCPTGVISLTVYVRPAAPTINASSPTCVTRNGGPAITTYSCNAVPGATDYTWNFAALGWTCNSGCNTTNPNVTPGGSGASAGLTVTANNVPTALCNSSPSAVYTVSYAPVAPIFNTIACWNSASPMPAFIDIPITNYQNFGTYTVTPNAAIFTGASSIVGTSVRLFGPVLLNASQTLVVTHSNGTCPAAVTNFGIAIGAAAASTVVYAGAGTFADNYNLTIAPGETFVAFQVNNVTVTNSATVNIFVGPTSGQLSLAGAPLAAGSTVSAIVSVGGCLRRIYSPTIGTRGNLRQAANGTGAAGTIAGITIYPNPNNGIFSIKMDHPATSASASVSDISGKLIGVYTLKQGDNKIQNERLPAGTYIVTMDVDGKTESRKIIIK